MGSTIPFQSEKGQILTTDATVALLLVLLILYVTFSTWTNIGIRTHEAQERDALLSRTIAVADYLMKDGLAHKDDSDIGIQVAHSHQLEEGKLDSPDVLLRVERAGLQNLCFDLNGTRESSPCSGRQVCIKRPVIINETKEVGYLVVCAG